MGKVTGFLELQRLKEASQAPEVRIKHWSEFVDRLSDEEAGKQGARCMDCGIPFCNNGCPVNNIIPDWNDLVYRQQWREALDGAEPSSVSRRRGWTDPPHDELASHVNGTNSRCSASLIRATLIL